MNSYKIISEILAGNEQPNVDLLIIKPMLYTYVKNESIPLVKKNGIRGDDKNQLHCYFSRIPEKLEMYQDFLSKHTCIRIQALKLEKIKDQKIRVIPYNISDYTKDLSKDDILTLTKKNSFFYNYFKRGINISEIPHAIIWMENNILPAFVYKVLE